MLYLQISIAMVLMAVLGGLGTVWGPIIGAMVLIGISEAARLHGRRQRSAFDLMIYGFLVMVVAVYQPMGLMGMLKGWRRRREGIAMPLLEVENLTKRFGGLVANDECQLDRQRGRNRRPHRAQRRRQDHSVQLHSGRVQPRGRDYPLSRAKTLPTTAPSRWRRRESHGRFRSCASSRR